jgi:paraquat-inducible protein A
MTDKIERSLISCEECGLVVEVPEIGEGKKAQCPRCNHPLIRVIHQPIQRPIAYALAALIMLLLSISFTFMSFSVEGLSQETSLLHAAKMLDEFQNSALAILLLLTVVVLPAIYLSIVFYLYSLCAKPKNFSTKQLHHIRILCKLLFRVEPWLMVDVFLIGVLVSLIKIAALADIGLGSSFWAFCLYTLLLVKCVSLIDRSWLWNQFIPVIPVENVKAGDSHLSGNHISCHICHQINAPASDKCIRCQGELHHYHVKDNLQKVWALLLTALLFYLPANLYPIMYTVSLGSSEPSTIIGGVILLWHHGSYPIAMVIFFASVFIPLAKIFSLAWLFLSAQRAANLPEEESIQRQKLYRLTEIIGRWSMIDIFVVAILVALVQLNNLMAIYPGPAALSFAAVVIFTMLSAMKFDSRILWQNITQSPVSGNTNYEQ